MRIVFMGTPDFAKKALERLYTDGHDIAGVFTQPDKPRDRGMKVSCSPVKALAVEYGVPVFQPASLNDRAIVETLRDLQCELLAVVAYGKLLPAEALEIPRYGCINIHASLLPKYRGAAPIQWAIINGEKETGVTSMYVSEKLDAGDTILAYRTQIGEDETAGELYERLSVLGAELLSATVDAISRGEAVRKPQNHEEATYAPLLSKNLSLIDWEATAYRIKRKVLGLNPWPVATFKHDEISMKVFSVDISNYNTGARPGEIVSTGPHGIEVACADGSVTIKELQVSDGKRMAAADYLKGHSLQ